MMIMMIMMMMIHTVTMFSHILQLRWRVVKFVSIPASRRVSSQIEATAWGNDDDDLTHGTRE